MVVALTGIFLRKTQSMEINWKIVYDVLLYITRDDGGLKSAMISSENLPKRLRNYTFQEILYACNVLYRHGCLTCNVGSNQIINIENINDGVCKNLILELYNKLSDLN